MVAMVAEKTYNRLQNVNGSILRNFNNYLNNLKKYARKQIKKPPYAACEYTHSECYCPNALYYSLLYNSSVPCIHTILNDTWSKENAAETWFKDKEIILRNIRNELIVHNLDIILDFSINEYRKVKELITENVNIPTEKYADNIAQMIYECHCQLNKVMNIDKIEVATIALKVQEAMLKDKDLMKLKETSPDEINGVMKIKIWKKAYEEKNMLLYF